VENDKCPLADNHLSASGQQRLVIHYTIATFFTEVNRWVALQLSAFVWWDGLGTQRGDYPWGSHVLTWQLSRFGAALST